MRPSDQLSISLDAAEQPAAPRVHSRARGRGGCRPDGTDRTRAAATTASSTRPRSTSDSLTGTRDRRVDLHPDGPFLDTVLGDRALLLRRRHPRAGQQSLRVPVRAGSVGTVRGRCITTRKFFPRVFPNSVWCSREPSRISMGPASRGVRRTTGPSQGETFVLFVKEWLPFAGPGRPAGRQRHASGQCSSPLTAESRTVARPALQPCHSTRVPTGRRRAVCQLPRFAILDISFSTRTWAILRCSSSSA